MTLLPLSGSRPLPRHLAGEGAPAVAPGLALPRLLAASGVVALIGVLVLQLTAPDVLRDVGLAVAVVGILIGIPHGAVDHMVPFWTAGARPAAATLGRVLVGYLAVAATAAAALTWAPAVTVLLFLVASGAHFGRAEVVFAAERAGRGVPALREDLLAAAAHGAAVVVLPVVLWHELAADVLGRLAPALAVDVPAGLLAGAAAAVLGLAAVAVARTARAGRRREAVELALVVTVFAVVPPLPAFGAYFGGWHALRHTSRLLALPGPGGARLTAVAATRRYLTHATVPTAVATGALIWFWHNGSHSFVSAAVAVVLALTFPHLRTVASLDRWAAARPGR